MNIKKKGNNPAYAANCFLQGLKLVGNPALRKYLVIPILINLVLYSIVLGLGYFYVAGLILTFIPVWLAWLGWLIWPIFLISFSAIGFFTFTLVANLIASPFYSQLSAKTVDLVSGRKNTVKEQAINKVVIAEIKRAGYLLSRMLPLLILFIIPGINLIAPFLWMLFGAWGMGLEFTAYPFENKGILFKQQKEIAKSRRIGVISFGGCVIVGLSIPVFNLIVAPAAVIGATIYLHGLSEPENN